MASPDRHFAAGALFTETAAPGTPNANDVWLYPKSDGRFYGKDDAGTEFPIGTIGGTTGTTDNVVPRANGTGGSTIQDSGLVVEDTVVSFAVTGDAATDVITATGSAFANDQPVRFTALTGGAGLNTTTNYYVINVSGATFQVSTSIGGSPSLFTTNITAGTLLTGHSVQTNVALSQNTTELNSALVLTPKGTGAFILGQKPDLTSVGGNARGNNAVDLQLLRNASTQVASGGQAFIGGGQNHTASGQHSVVGGGVQNTCSGQAATVCGGRLNSASAIYAAVIGGDTNTASADSSLAFGRNCTANVFGAISLGREALSSRSHMIAHAAGQFASNGDAQRARFVLRNATTNDTPTALFLDGSTTRLTIPVNKAMGFTIQVVGSYQGMSENAYFVRKGLIVNDNLTTTIVGAVETLGTDQKSAGATGTDVTVTADDTNEALIITVTGVAAQNWRWVASVDAVEVQYA
jgi:hypothetical protein